MPVDPEGVGLRRDILALLSQEHGAIDPARVDALALAASRWQRARCPALARIADATLDWAEPARVDEIPAVPSDVFKVARVACFDAASTARTFRTSGTTGEARGEHHFDDLALYTQGSLSAARRWLLPRDRYVFALLCPDEDEAPDSSLAFMLARFVDVWGGDGSFCVRASRLDVARVDALLAAAAERGAPVAMLGASYAFVHLFDAWGERRAGLPEGSVVMPTGGFKGRSRELDPAAFHALIGARLGVERAQIVGEYGMTELSSQAYEAHREGCAPGIYRAPPWMRVTAVDPSSLARLPDGETGLLRVVDLANLGSSIAIQTSDLGRAWGDTFEVHGRAPGATPRGCARAIDAALSGER